MNIYFTGYTKNFLKTPHTNFWPWQYLVRTINDLGYNAYHIELSKIDFKKPHVFICWNNPDSIQLIEKYNPHKDSIIVQKLTHLDTSQESQQWKADNTNFYEKLKTWSWPQYRKLDYLNKSGYKFHAFGAKTDIKSFKEKKRIVNQYSEQIFWIPWGSMTVPYEQIINAKPILSNFKYDLGFVGSRWGTYARGNLWEWENYLDPLVRKSPSSFVAGKGTKRGVISTNKHMKILTLSRICPIIHATGWKAEKGVMDRFWTIFSLGRFGVVDNPGVYDFFNEDEVVMETEIGTYFDKSLYFMKNVKKQGPYIEKVLGRIKNEYNQHDVWKNIMKKILPK